MSGTDQRRISLVLLPPGEVGRAILANAREWADHGLLQRSVWIFPEQIDESGPVAATLVQAGGAIEDVSPFRLLSRMRLAGIQVLVLRTPDGEDTGDEAQAVAAMRLKAAIVSSLPAPRLDESGIPHDVVQPTWVNLIAPTSRVSDLSVPALTINGYATVVAAPEDRRTPAQLNGFVDAGEQHRAWALAQTASILGLWIGVAEGPLGEFERRHEDIALGRERSDRVLVFRSFTRIVTAAPVARREVSRAMVDIMGQEVNVVLPSTQIAVEPDPMPWIGEFIERLSGNLLETASIAPFEPTPEPEKERASPGRIFHEFRQFSAREIKALPREWYWRIARRIQRWMQGKAEKEGEVIYEVVVRDDIPPDHLMGDAFEARLAENRERLPLNLPPRPSSSVPRTWQILRRGALALLDGSPMPEELKQLSRRSNRNNPVVLPLSTMSVPRPEPWSVDFEDPRRFDDIQLEDARVYPGDPEGADRILVALADAIDGLAARQAVMSEELQSLESQLQEIQTEREEIAVELEAARAAAGGGGSDA